MHSLDQSVDQFEEELERHKNSLLSCVAAVENHARSLKQPEEGLSDSEQALRALLENASQGIITIDGPGTIVQATAMALRMFGYSSEELLGAPMEGLCPARCGK